MGTVWVLEYLDETALRSRLEVALIRLQNAINPHIRFIPDTRPGLGAPGEVRYLAAQAWYISILSFDPKREDFEAVLKQIERAFSKYHVEVTSKDISEKQAQLECFSGFSDSIKEGMADLAGRLEKAYALHPSKPITEITDNSLVLQYNAPASLSKKVKRILGSGSNAGTAP